MITSGAVESVKRPLVEHLDAILTSVGSKDQPGRFWIGEFFRQGEIDLPKLHRGESVKKWDWLRAETTKTLENQRSRRCLSQFFHSLRAFGDLGGALIINPEADKADREYVQALNERWTGIKEPHFRRCAVRARENNLPGVTVLAVGRVRAEIVLQCIRLGLINHLILDTDCAGKLHRLLRVGG